MIAPGAGMRIVPLLLILGAGAALAGPPDFPAPPDARVQAMGGSTVVGGRAMQIRQFHTDERPERVHEFYRRKWQAPPERSAPGFAETDVMSPWHIISRVEDGWLMTVQAQRTDAGGTWGYLAMSRVDEPAEPEPEDPGVPVMADTRVLQRIASRDPGQTGATILLANRHSLASNVNYYRQRYQGDGWRGDMDKAIPAAKMHVLAYTGGRRRINIVLTGDERETQVIINDVVHDILRD
jgi:hypothetical protein